MELRDQLTFENTSLWGADLTEANLQHANLTKAYLSLADLPEANLYEADLTEAYFMGANLTETNLIEADLTGAYLGPATLSRAVLMNADLPEANLYEADLTEAFLHKANLTEANLQEANLTEANLREANLTDANLREANLTEGDLAETDLCGANFLRATLKQTALPAGSEFRKGDFTEASLQGHDFRDENLSGATLEKADLTGCELSQANLSKANLERALLNRADMFDTELTGARLEGTILGDTQINEGTFERLAPEARETDNHQSIRERLRALVLGPTGNDAYRCVYDPASQFDLDGADGEDSVITESESPSEKVQDCSGHEDMEDDPEVRAGGVYRQFERLAADNALPEWQRRFFILRQDMQIRQSTGLGYAFGVVRRALFGYGESFGRVVAWSAAIVATFAAVYLAGGWVRPVESGGSLGRPVSWTQLPGDPSVLWESFYYSTLTFTALGFGDFRPVGTLGQFLTVLETASGALLLALLVFVLGRRAAR